MNFYALLTFPGDKEICLAISARDMPTALDQVNAWISGLSSANTIPVPIIHSISASKPRGIEAQVISNWVKLS